MSLAYIAQSEYIYLILGVVSIIVYAICYAAEKHMETSHRDSQATALDSQDETVLGVKAQMLQDASAKSLQLDMEMIDAINRMNDVASNCKDETF